MSRAIDFQKMKRELIELYERFIENPGARDTNEKIIAYHLQFEGLSSYNNFLASQPAPKSIERALSELSTIYQYGLWEDNHEAFSNDKILLKAKKILEELRKS